jgi:hypothetical protein
VIAAGAAAPRLAVLALLLAALATAGCQAAISSPAEYASFRQTRVAPTVEARLQASARYLEAYPSGHWSKPVRSWLVRADRVYFKAKRGSAAGLQAYLRAVPTGAHRAEARRLLAARAAQADAGDDLARAGSETESRLAAAAGERAEARATVDGWLRRFVALAAWQRPLRDAAPDLAEPWSAGVLPACSDDPAGRRCVKTIDVTFSVPVSGQQEKRTLTLAISTSEDASGRLLDVALAGPALFARLEEAASLVPYDAADPSAQMTAVLHATELVDAAFAALVAPVSECRKPTVAPVVRDLDCRGARVTVVAGGAGEHDRIVIRRTPPP